MNSVLDTLFLRRPKIEYVSPPVCEFNFSASGGPVIVLDDIFKRRAPTGLLLGGVGGLHLSWDAYPGSLCYSIYRADEEAGPYELIAECISDNFFDIPGSGWYRVSSITLDGETELSDPIQKVGSGTDCGCPEDFYDLCPTDLSGLIGWYAGDCLGLSDGDEVISWEDKAGIMGDATKDLIGGPIFKTNIFGIRPGLRFTGSQSLLIPSCPVFGEFTIIAISQTPGQVTIMGNTSTGDYYLRTSAHTLDPNSVEIFQGISSRSVRGHLTGTENMMTTVRRRDVIADQKAEHTQNNFGSSALPVFFSSGNFQFTNIGVGGFAYAPNDGYIAEICVWNRQLSDVEVNDIFEKYFQLKYSL